ncbi:MAG: lysoplasmalogenase [Deltaproteobacteria bacterium]|nr:lysoplasmalogenase [Deltaproteobacteria bacterium]
MLNVLIIVPAIILLGGLLYFEMTGNSTGKLPTKTALSSLFIIAALAQAHPVPTYYHILILGLIFCLGGDVFLALPQEKMFLFGLVSFLLGHVCYVLGFFYVANLNLWTWGGGAAGLAVSGLVFFWLRPHLGSMLVPVVAYIVIITGMVIGAFTVFGDAGLHSAGRNIVLFGAVSFYLSDLFVARDRFLKTEFTNRLLGLPLYYAGQFLLAFSVAYVRLEG